MKPSDVLDQIKFHRGLPNDAALASHLEITAGRVSQMRKSTAELSKKALFALLRRDEAAALKALMSSAILPIVEYYPIERVASKGDAKWEVLPTGASFPRNEKIKKCLDAEIGIYVFYDSQGVALYVGKTEKQNIWKEMIGAFNRERSNHMAYFVAHPTTGASFEPAFKNPRQPVKQIVYLCDTAHYFSAYKVNPLLVSKVEALMVRAFCNGLSNKKMEKF